MVTIKKLIDKFMVNRLLIENEILIGRKYFEFKSIENRRS